MGVSDDPWQVCLHRRATLQLSDATRLGDDRHEAAEDCGGHQPFPRPGETHERVSGGQSVCEALHAAPLGVGHHALPAAAFRL